jgi:hypothetical protein
MRIHSGQDKLVCGTHVRSRHTSLILTCILLTVRAAHVAGKTNAFAAITSLSMGEHPEKAYGASPEIILDGKPFKEVRLFVGVSATVLLTAFGWSVHALNHTQTN